VAVRSTILATAWLLVLSLCIKYASFFLSCRLGFCVVLGCVNFDGYAFFVLFIMDTLIIVGRVSLNQELNWKLI